MLLLIAIILGVVEGLTEFLPISSTGHLILVGNLLGAERHLGREATQAFEIFIQLGAILAVVVAYPGRFRDLLDLRCRSGFSGLRAMGLLAVTSIPAGLAGLLAHKHIHAWLFNPVAVAAALGVGALWILLVEHRLPHTAIDDLDALSWRKALAVGLFQTLALWPGMSRSTATILGGMLSGLNRGVAAEYSFLSAVPLLGAAACYSLYASWDALGAEHVIPFAVGFAVSFGAALLAIRAFVGFLRRHNLTPFAWYRLVLAGLVLWLWL